HVTRPISLRTSARKRRERPHQPVTLSRARPPNDSSCSAIAVFISHPCRRCRTGPETFDCPRRDPAGGWQARRESNPQPPVLETGALPIELLAYIRADGRLLSAISRRLPAVRSLPVRADYLVSRWAMCLRQKRQYLLSSSRSVVFFLFLVVL